MQGWLYSYIHVYTDIHTHACAIAFPTAFVFKKLLAVLKVLKGLSSYWIKITQRKLENWALCEERMVQKCKRSLIPFPFASFYFSVPHCTAFHFSAPYYPSKPCATPTFCSFAFIVTNNTSFCVLIEPGQVAIACSLTHVNFSHSPYWKCATVLALQDSFFWMGFFQGDESDSFCSFSHCTAALMFLFFPVTRQWQYLFCDITLYQAVWWRDKFIAFYYPTATKC